MIGDNATFDTGFSENSITFDANFSPISQTFDSELSEVSYGSSNNYIDLKNKPEINGIELVGNIPSESLNVASIVYKVTHFEFPNIGNENNLYIAKEENKTYRYDKTDNKYYVVGSDYSEINLIDGGNAYV